MTNATGGGTPTQQPQQTQQLNSNRAQSRPIKDLYLYDMPAKERHDLCLVLDINNSWTTLAKHMNYEPNMIQEIQRSVSVGSSPSDELLTTWAQLNHTVTELFVLLSRMQHFQAMETIKSLVDTGYHRLMQPIIEKKNEMDRMTNKMNMIGISSKAAVVSRKKISEKILNGPPNDVSVEENDRVSGSGPSIPSASAHARQAVEYAGNILQINYQELVEATGAWNKENILGRGGFGIVYKGKWKQTEVAIKKMQYKDRQSAQANRIQMQQSLNELRHLNSFRHDNILPVYGYSLSGEEPCLVYQLMLGGSLEYRLFTRSSFDPLTWRQKVNIARGSARGLQFLHTVTDKPLIHGDVKPANILLDPCCQAKIADFGLAREASKAEKVVSQVYGTVPYLAPEFFHQKRLSTKVDVFGFGVVLFEMATGLRAHDKLRHPKLLFLYLRALRDANQLDDMMERNNVTNDDEVRLWSRKLLRLGFECTSENPDDRPEMVKVLEQLEGNDNSQLQP